MQEEAKQEQPAMKRQGSLFSARLPFVRFDQQNQATLVNKAPGLKDAELKDFLVTHLLGQGAFGKVFLGELPGSS